VAVQQPTLFSWGEGWQDSPRLLSRPQPHSFGF
jgi:hypothetical protein